MELETSYTPREQAILRILNELTPRWQKFASESLTDAETEAMTSLVRCGFAKTKLTYCVHNDLTDYCVSQRFILSGNFLGNQYPYLTDWRGPVCAPLFDVIAAQCPPDWFSSKPMVSNPARQVIVESSGVNITQSENGWELAITDNGRQWQSDSSEDYLILIESGKQNAAAVIKKGAGERIYRGTAAPANEQGHQGDTVAPSDTDKNTSRGAPHFKKDPPFSSRTHPDTVKLATTFMNEWEPGLNVAEWCDNYAKKVKRPDWNCRKILHDYVSFSD